MTTGQRIKTLRKAAKITQEQLAKMTGYTDRSSIAKIESGKAELSESKIKQFAEILNTTPADLMGLTEITEINPEDTVSFDITGDVAAGYNRFAEIIDDLGKIEIPSRWLHGRRKTDYFVLRVSGDSMFPLYQDGDLVLVLKQDVTEYSGQIAVVLYDDDKATLKRVEYSRGENWLNLVPVNPQFPPISINGESLNHCKILGIPRLLIRRTNGNM